MKRGGEAATMGKVYVLKEGRTNKVDQDNSIGVPHTETAVCEPLYPLKDGFVQGGAYLGGWLSTCFIGRDSYAFKHGRLDQKSAGDAVQDEARAERHISDWMFASHVALNGTGALPEKKWQPHSKAPLFFGLTF